jgi:hypothetical protein
VLLLRSFGMREPKSRPCELYLTLALAFLALLGHPQLS